MVSPSTGQILVPFNESRDLTIPRHVLYVPNYNFSLDSTGTRWNEAIEIPLSTGPRQLVMPSSGVGRGDYFTFANPWPTAFNAAFGSNIPAIDTTVVGLWQPDINSDQVQLGAASTGWTSTNLSASAPYSKYPDWSSPFVPIAELDGTDGPKAAFDEDTGVALITASLVGGDDFNEILLRLYSGPRNLSTGMPAALGTPCLGNPKSEWCPELRCVNVAPYFIPGLPPNSADRCGAACATTSCNSGRGSRANMHAPVLGFGGRAYVLFMYDTQLNQGGSGRQIPVLAVYDYRRGFIAWVSLAWAVAPNDRVELSPGCDQESTTGNRACISDCSGEHGVRSGNIPSLAHGFDAQRGKDLLYAAWSFTSPPQSPPNPKVWTKFITVEVDRAVWPPEVRPRNMFVSTDPGHNEYIPAVAAVPTSGKVGLFFLSDASENCNAGSCQTDACAAHIIGCTDSNGGGLRALPDGSLELVTATLSCAPVSEAFPVEPYAGSDEGSYVTDYLGATSLPNGDLLVTWVEALQGTGPSCQVGRASAVDPPSPVPNNCEAAEQLGHEACCEQFNACSGASEDTNGRLCGHGRNGAKPGHDDGAPGCLAGQGRGVSPAGGPGFCLCGLRACLKVVDEALAHCRAQQRAREAALAALGDVPALAPVAGIEDLGPVAAVPVEAGSLGATCHTSGDCNPVSRTECSSGTCMCPGTLRPCGPLPMSCVDLASDRSHCGVCGVSCLPSEVCDAGRCVE